MSAELLNTVNLFGTIAKELHNRHELPSITELRLIVLSGVIHSSLKFRWIQPRGLLTKISNYWKWTFSAHTCKGTYHVSFAAKKSKHQTHRLNDNHSQPEKDTHGMTSPMYMKRDPKPLKKPRGAVFTENLDFSHLLNKIRICSLVPLERNK